LFLAIAFLFVIFQLSNIHCILKGIQFLRQIIGIMGQDLSAEREVLDEIYKIPIDHKGIDDYVQRSAWSELYEKLNSFIRSDGEISNSTEVDKKKNAHLKRDLERMLNVKLVQVSSLLLERLTLLAKPHRTAGYPSKDVYTATQELRKQSKAAIHQRQSAAALNNTLEVLSDRASLVLRALSALLSVPHLSKEFTRMDVGVCLFYLESTDPFLPVLALQVLRAAMICDRPSVESRRAARQHAANAGAFRVVLEVVQRAQVSAEKIGLPPPVADPHSHKHAPPRTFSVASRVMAEPAPSSPASDVILPLMYTVWMGIDLFAFCLDYDEGITDSETLRIVQASLREKRALLLDACRHQVSVIREAAWRTLRLLLLHSEISQATGLQEYALSYGSLLWHIYVCAGDPFVECCDADCPQLRSSLCDAPGGPLQIVFPPEQKLYHMQQTAHDLVEILSVGQEKALELFARAVPFWILDYRHALYTDDELLRFWPKDAPFKDGGSSNFLEALFGRNNKKELPARTLWFTPFGAAVAGQNWRAVLNALDRDAKSPDHMWDETSRQELRFALRRSIDQFDYLKAHHNKTCNKEELKWQLESFEVDYPSHRMRLLVGGYFLLELLPAMERGFEILEPTALLWQLYDRLIVENNGQWRLVCLCTMWSLLIWGGQNLGSQLPVRFLTGLLREKPPQESFLDLNDATPKISAQRWYRQIMLVLHAALDQEDSSSYGSGVVREFVRVGGLDSLIPFFCYPQMIFQAEQEPENTTNIDGIESPKRPRITSTQKMNCPGRHGLISCKNEQVHALCDLCKKRIDLRVKVYSCRICNFDICPVCCPEEDSLRLTTDGVVIRNHQQRRSIPYTVKAESPKKSMSFVMKATASLTSAQLAVMLAKICLQKTALGALSLGLPECLSAMLGGLMVLGGHFGRQREADTDALGALFQLLLATLRTLPLSYPDLHLTGLFHFVLLACVAKDGTGRMTPAAAALLRLSSHVQFNTSLDEKGLPDASTHGSVLCNEEEGANDMEVSEDASDDFMFLGYFLPLQLVKKLPKVDDQSFADIFNSDLSQPHLIWNKQLRLDLLTSIRKETCQFERALEASPTSATFHCSESTMQPVVYPALMDHPQVRGVFLGPLLECNTLEDFKCLGDDAPSLLRSLLEELDRVSVQLSLSGKQVSPRSASSRTSYVSEMSALDSEPCMNLKELWCSKSLGFQRILPLEQMTLLVRSAWHLADHIQDLAQSCKSCHFQSVWKALQCCLFQEKRRAVNITQAFGYLLCTLLVQTEGKNHSQAAHGGRTSKSLEGKHRSLKSVEVESELPALSVQTGEMVVSDETASPQQSQCRRLFFIQEGGLDFVLQTISCTISRVHKCVEMLFQDKSRLAQMSAEQVGFAQSSAGVMDSIGSEIIVLGSLLVFLAPLCHECGSGVMNALRANKELFGLLVRLCAEDYATCIPRVSLLAMNCISTICKDVTLQLDMNSAGLFVVLLNTALVFQPPGQSEGRRNQFRASSSPIQNDRDVHTKLWGHSRQAIIDYLHAEIRASPQPFYFTQSELSEFEPGETTERNDEATVKLPCLGEFMDISHDLVMRRCASLLQQLAQSTTVQVKDTSQTAMLKNLRLIYTQLLTPGLHKKLLLDPPGFLEILRAPKVTRTPTIIWNDETR